MATLTHKGYGCIYCETADDVPKVEAVVKELDEYEFGYMPKGLVSSARSATSLCGTSRASASCAARYMESDMSELTVMVEVDGIKYSTQQEVAWELERVKEQLDHYRMAADAEAAQVDRLTAQVKEQNEQLAAAQARIAELVEALRYYADANWVIDSDLKGAWLGDGEPCAVANKALATTDNLEALNRERARVLREVAKADVLGTVSKRYLEMMAQEYMEGKR